MTDVNDENAAPGGKRETGEPNLRNSKGQYQSGRSGNPRGRPHKRPLVISDRQELAYFFEVDRELVTITLNGRRKKVPGIVAAYRLIRKKGLEGDYRYMKLFVDLRKQFAQYADQTRARKFELVLELIAQAKASKQMSDRTADLINKTLKDIDKSYDL